MNRKVWYGKEDEKAGCNSWVKGKSAAKEVRDAYRGLGQKNKDKPFLLRIIISFMISHRLL